jgi:hypothetical protein
MPLFAKHSCGDSKLGCVECSNQICPKCMVICPVGNRCHPCADKTASHTVKVTPAIMVRTGLVALVVGGLFGYGSGYLPMGGFYGWIICYAIGVFVGNFVHRVSGYKLGKRISTVVAVALLVGALGVPAVVGKMGGGTRQAQAAQLAQYLAENDALVDDDDQAEAVNKTAGNESSGAQPDHRHKMSPEARARMYQQLVQMSNHGSMYMGFNLIDIAVFCFGVVSPFAGIAPFTFGRFRRY